MRYLLLLIAMLQLADVSAQAGPPRLVIRGDDMGYSHSGNLALIKSFKEGIETAIEVIVPSPWFPEAVKLLKANPGADIGIHLALTSEWENIKWRPLTDCKSLKDSNGYFYPMVSANKNYPGQSVLENKWTLADIEMEFRAQIELGIKLLPGVSHLSAHMGCTNLAPEVAELTRRLAAEYKIAINPDTGHQGYITYDGPHRTLAEKLSSFKKMLEKLEKGKSYIFLDHPGLADAELKAIYHTGYEEVAMDRQGVTDLFTDPAIKVLIREKGILLIGYKDL